MATGQTSRPFAPRGNTRVLWLATLAFTLGFGVWSMFAALGPFLIKWYQFSPSQALLLAAMPPFFASVVSIPLGIATDRAGGRLIFTVLLCRVAAALVAAAFVDGYAGFLCVGMLLGLGGASFVVGNAHVSTWFPQERQGTALGIFALGNIGIVLGMVLVPTLVNNVLGGPAGYADLPPKVTVGSLAGWRLIFLVFALPSLLMAAVYWFMTSDAPRSGKKRLTVAEIAAVYKSGWRVWAITYLYWTSFGTLTFFSAFMPTYLNDRWAIDGAKAATVFTSIIVVCVALMRPLGGWLADRRDPIRLLVGMFAVGAVFALLLVGEFSFAVQMVAVYGLALLAGASAATVVKLIPSYFPHAVGAVSGLAKAAGAACGFTMSVTMALSKDVTGGYQLGFMLWAAMNIGSLLLVAAPAIWRQRNVSEGVAAAGLPAAETE